MISNTLANIKKVINNIGIHFLILLSAFLNIYGISRLGYGNSYYAAAIKNMMTSFSNFFFLSFDSTGFISVDKAPLSLWVDTISAKVFGFSGFSILLPHAVEGILITVLVYLIMKKIAGKSIGFISSLLITVSPINVAVYRNNTPDALLLVFILLSIYFFIKYFSDKKIIFLMISAIMLGLGFNTKMLQAYLILPALLIVLILFTPGKFNKKITSVIFFCVISAIVSFSWITIVDLVPADLRPFVGGSENNSAWNLAFGYNGSQRLFGENGIGGNPGFNVGDKGILRLFTGEMGTQTGWFLISAIGFSIYFLVKNYRYFLDLFLNKKQEINIYKIFVFANIMFLITEYVFFSFASFFHSYYLNILAIPIVFLIGSLIYELARLEFRNILLWIILFISVPVQTLLIHEAKYGTYIIPIILTIGLGLLIVALMNLKAVYNQLISVGLIATLLIAPFVWSFYTTFKGNTSTAIFIGGPEVASSNIPNNRDGNITLRGDGNAGRPPMNNFRNMNNQNPPAFQDGNNINNSQKGMFDAQEIDSELINYLKDNYNNEKYFVAVFSATQASGFILNEDIGNIMALGGFSGRDQVLSLDEIKQIIENGEIRFFYFNETDRSNNNNFNDNIRPDGNFTLKNQFNNISQNPDGGNGGGMFNANKEITSWIKENCNEVETLSGLFDCKVS